MNIDEKRLALKRSLRLPKEMLEDEEMMYHASEKYLIIHLRAIVHALRILGEPKTDDDFIELFGKSEDELFREYQEEYHRNPLIEYRAYDFWQTILENELAHRV